jgi:hypothetical protein
MTLKKAKSFSAMSVEATSRLSPATRWSWPPWMQKATMMKMMQSQQQKMKKKMNSKAARAAVTGLALAVGMLAVSPTAVTAHAQQRGPVRRSIEGRVHDKNDTAIKGAVVYLKDSRTLAVKSFISDEEGNFHFGQLSQNTDYELYAEFDGKRSKSKTISSFDNKNDFNFTLKIETSK